MLNRKKIFRELQSEVSRLKISWIILSLLLIFVLSVQSTMVVANNGSLIEKKIGEDIDCRDLSSWEAFGYSGYMGYDRFNLPELVDEGGNLHSYDFSAYNGGREGLTVRDVNDTHEEKSDGRAIEIAIDTTEETYSSFDSSPQVILRQHINWTQFVFKNPDQPNLTQAPEEVSIIIRYRIEYGGDLLNTTLYPGDTPRDHFNIKSRAMREDQAFDSLMMMNHPAYAEFDLYDPREYYGLDDMEISTLLVYDVFTWGGFSGGGGSLDDLNPDIILQLEVAFDDIDDFNGSIKIIIDQYYMILSFPEEITSIISTSDMESSSSTTFSNIFSTRFDGFLPLLSSFAVVKVFRRVSRKKYH